MLAELRKCIEKPPAVEIYDLVDALHSCRQAPGKPVSEHVLKMKGLMDQLHTLGKPYDNDMAVNLINRSLNKDFGDFELPSLYRRVAANKTKSEPGAAVQEFKKKELSYGDQYLQVGQWKPSSCLKHKCFELDFTFGLAHIGKTRMQKLHREGLLENIDEESFDKCESCISGKMTKKPFNKNIERATDLLVVMDMFIYLNIKHEVFETFKVFKAEVELQLGKKIKALRSDRGGEYLSQEFKDYLSENGIVQNLTSPYTPQQNGVSERRNRTLLDMVRSMFNLTTLPLSFWDYALRNLCRSLKYDLLEKEIFISQEFSGRDYDLEDDHMDTLPSKNTSEILGDLGEPANYKTAMLDPDKVIWQGAMDEEMNSMKVNEVWTEVDPPPNAKIVRNVSLSDIRAIRILIAIAAYYDYEIWQMDVKTAFLNGRLDEDIYMEQPEGLKEVKDYLGKCFSMKDLGEAAYILGIKIYRDRSLRLIGLNQSAYIDKILKKFIAKTLRMNYHVCCQFAQGQIVAFACSKHVYGGNPDTELEVTGFCDASWQCDKDDTKSQTGYVFVVNGGAVYRRAKKADNHCKCMQTAILRYMLLRSCNGIQFGLGSLLEILIDAFNK
ncbi:retrotransposon protein, putative, ty1-copia subclass [Tanacetum coccineum]